MLYFTGDDVLVTKYEELEMYELHTSVALNNAIMSRMSDWPPDNSFIPFCSNPGQLEAGLGMAVYAGSVSSTGNLAPNLSGVACVAYEDVHAEHSHPFYAVFKPGIDLMSLDLAQMLQDEIFDRLVDYGTEWLGNRMMAAGAASGNPLVVGLGGLVKYSPEIYDGITNLLSFLNAITSASSIPSGSKPSVSDKKKWIAYLPGEVIEQSAILRTNEQARPKVQYLDQQLDVLELWCHGMSNPVGPGSTWLPEQQSQFAAILGAANTLFQLLAYLNDPEIAELAHVYDVSPSAAVSPADLFHADAAMMLIKSRVCSNVRKKLELQRVQYITNIVLSDVRLENDPLNVEIVSMPDQAVELVGLEDFGNKFLMDSVHGGLAGNITDSSGAVSMRLLGTFEAVPGDIVP